MSGEQLKAMASMPEEYLNRLEGLPPHIMDDVVNDLPKFRKLVDSHIASLQSFGLDKVHIEQIAMTGVIQHYDPSYDLEHLQD